MRRCLPWLVPLLVALLVGPCRAQGRIDCNALQSHTLGESVHYCVMLPPDYDAATAGHSPRHYPVLYFMHGLGDNEQTLFKSGGWDLIQDLRQKRQVPDFLVVAPEGRRSFYITPPMAACDIAISSSASSFLTSSRIIRFDASAPREPLAVFRWADMAPFGLPSPTPSYSRPSARRVPRSSRNRRGRPRVGCSGRYSEIRLTCLTGTKIVRLFLRSGTGHKYGRRVCPSISTAAVRMNSDLIKELRNSIGNFRLRTSDTNIISIPATTAVSIFWHTSVKY